MPSKSKSYDHRVAGSGPAWGTIIVVSLVIAALAAAWRYTPLSELITADRVSEWAKVVRRTPWAPLALMLAYVPAAFVMFPRPVLTLVGIIAFGPWLGFTYSMLGITLAGLATFYAGRALPKKTVKRIAGARLEHVSQRLKRHGILAVAALRFVPAAPFGVESMIVGALGIKVLDHTLGTLIGMAPGVLLMTVFGTQITNALEDPSRINYWIVGATLLVFILLTFWVSRWLVKRR